jgi:YVTN family beta-propeller protein
LLVAFDTATNEFTGSVKVGARPWGVGISPDGRTLYTANGPSGDVSIVDTGSFKVTGTVKAGRGPWGVAIR